MTRPLTRRLKTVWVAVRLALILTIVLGIAYPLLITGIGQLALNSRANGSLVETADGRVAGSALIGQNFTGADGAPLPEYFQPRPSAADYDALASGGSNLGPESPQLVAQIAERLAAVAAFNGVAESDVPPDAVTASGSGLDPDISPEYARIQVQRVADARGLQRAEVRTLVEQFTAGRDLGYIGEPRVNVLKLNLALDALRQGQ